MTERVWIIVAGVCLLAAAVFLWRDNLSGAFVSATLGVVAWFLSFRAQVRAKLATETEPDSIEETNED